MSQGFTRGVPIDTDPNLSLDSDLVVPSQKAVKDYIDTGLADKVDRAGDTMSGNLILNTNPTLPLQAATKDYVDTLINGIDWKQSADAGTVAVLPTYTVSISGLVITGTINGSIPSVTTDGATLTANQRLLVKNETSTQTPNNGIYVVTQVGSGSLPFILTRSSDANTPALLAEATLSVKVGTTLANTQWHCNPASIPIVIGTTNITFAQIGGGGITGLIGDVTATGPGSVTATLNTSFTAGSFGVTFDGGLALITSGKIGYARVPYKGTIIGWQLVADQSGSCSIEVKQGTFGSFPPPTTIFTAVLPSGRTANNTVSFNVTAGDWFSFTITGTSAVTLVNLSISITKII